MATDTLTRPRLDDNARHNRRDEVPDDNGDTVVVMCNLPNGILIENFHEVEEYEPVLGGGSRLVKRFERTPGTQWKINGTALDIESLKRNRMPDYVIAGHYAMTTDVPKIIWDRWYEVNKREPICTNKCIFAATGDRNARSQARDYNDLRSGMEPVDPENPGRFAPDVGKGSGRSAVKPFDPKEDA